ncbi:hypothetical protein EV193_105403 [Herbihabitans rhizosphaerae]|uniref:Uncharacterized protein n=2 Tax=Herbihabitans rhizosphaerae TaxID=1872711 RepID=A0A4V2ESK0_9PSEU|nr:hypothetical protein EV193_105403 [Herbihabitans rhizosphaerae]
MTMLAPGEMANLGRGCVGLLSDYHLLVIKNWGNRDFTHQVKNVTTWIEKFVAEGRTDLGVATDKDVPMSWMTSNH